MNEFVVYFENKGFYAQDQKGSFHWILTPELAKAKKYKTLKGASDLYKRAVSIHEDIILRKRNGDLNAGLYKEPPKGNKDWNNLDNWTVEDGDLFPVFIYKIKSKEIEFKNLIPISPTESAGRRSQIKDKEKIDIDSLLKDFH